jgi:hypothetical protein
MHLSKPSFLAAIPILMACASAEFPTSPMGKHAISSVVARSQGLAQPGSFLFHDCTGPAGTPQSFTAEKIELPVVAAPTFAQSTAYQFTDGSAIFYALIRVGRHEPPGIEASGLATTTCLVDTPVGTVLFKGFITLTT